MKIGLIDVDSHNFPNLALMKISAYHKRLGDDVSMYMPIFDYDIVYMSKIFTFTKDIKNVRCGKIIKGGTGYDIKKTLPDKIDNLYPDYSLYNIADTAYGYLTRGCPRRCDFCIVSENEGTKTFEVYKLNQFYKKQRNIKLLDPNITAASNCVNLFNELAETGAYVDFTQGLDLRLLTDDKIEAIKKIKIKQIHFAWDKMEDESLVCDRLSTFIKETKYGYQKVAVYVLTNFNTTFDQDLYRIYKIRDLGANPYVMIYDVVNADKKYKHLQRYVNSRRIFRTVKSFNDYYTIKNEYNTKKGR